MPKATQWDIAKLANVDRTSVSKILSGYQLERFSSDIIEKVKNTARDLGYKLPGIAKSLDISLIFNMPDTKVLVEPRSFRILEALTSISEIIDGTAIRFNIRRCSSKLKPEFLNDDGYLIWESSTSNLHIINHLIKEQQQFIILNRNDLNLDCSYIIHDDSQDYGLVIQHLIDNNHKRIAFLYVKKKQDSSLVQAGIKAIKKLAIKNRLNFSNENLIPLDLNSDTWNKVNVKLEKMGITGVVAQSDEIAYQFIGALRNFGKKVPRDVSVTGNIHVPHTNPVKLTSVKLKWDIIASEGIKLLISQLRGKNQQKKQRIIKSKLVVGKTVRRLETGN